jgi:hypothetical protein
MTTEHTKKKCAPSASSILAAVSRWESLLPSGAFRLTAKQAAHYKEAESKKTDGDDARPVVVVHDGALLA